MASILPLTEQQHERVLDDPALCEQLPVRDYLDNVMVRTNGALVAGFELRGITSYFASDEDRDRSKVMLGALLKSIPEQSMRVQVRYEVVEDVGDMLEAYACQNRSENEIVRTLDLARLRGWRGKLEDGHYLRPLLHVYFIWDPRIHHRVTGKLTARRAWSLSAKVCIQRDRQEHEELVAEFESLLVGIETTMMAAELGPCRLTDNELFLETKRALNPVVTDERNYIPGEDHLQYRSAREQLANVSLVHETDSYLNIDGLLYSVVSLKELPDATFPGILRELVSLDFPIIVSAQLTLPDQAKVLKGYKSRLRKMQAAQRDTHGGFRVNVEAQVAESQLFKVQQDIIASSIKTTRLSLVIGTRTSKPAVTRGELDEAERLISNRRQQLLYAIARMNGAKAVTETLAKKRLFFSSLPGMAEGDRREQDMLTTNATDLIPMETPWRGTPRSPLFLLETPYRQLIPFSLFDPHFSDANLLIMAKSGGGKTFMVQQLLSMASRANPLVSIIERGDSYAPLVELMGGRMITMSLDANHTINPWDLPSGAKQPANDQVAFLKNLTRHMLGENSAEDTELLDILITEAILRTYKRAAIRPSNSIPTFSDLRDELSQWRDQEKNQRVTDEAHLAAIKLRSWTGEKGIYSRLFDQPTTVSLDDPWLFFNVEQLADDPRLETAMSLLIAHATAQRASGRTGQPSITVLDECWFLLDSAVLAPEVVQLFRTARKRNASVWGISQTAEDFVGSEAKPRPHGPGIVKNSSTKIVGQQPGDMTALREHLHLNETALHQIKHFSSPCKGRSADALIVIGEKADTTHTIRMVPTPVDYWITTTYARERNYRRWWLSRNKDKPLIDAYQALAKAFPFGLADVGPLPEEESLDGTKGLQV
jgi:type IV secretory pathway VirB4 component